MRKNFESHKEEMLNEISEIEYDLSTFDLGHSSREALEKAIKDREIFIEKMEKIFK